MLPHQHLAIVRGNAVTVCIGDRQHSGGGWKSSVGGDPEVAYCLDRVTRDVGRSLPIQIAYSLFRFDIALISGKNIPTQSDLIVTYLAKFGAVSDVTEA